MKIPEKAEINAETPQEIVRTSTNFPRTRTSDQLQAIFKDYPAYGVETRLVSLTRQRLAEGLSVETNPVALLFTDRL
jgi:hypothetical protein